MKPEHHNTSRESKYFYRKMLINRRKCPISCFNERDEFVCSSTEWQNFIIKWSSGMLMQVLQVRNYIENQDMNETAGFVYDRSYIGLCQYNSTWI